MPYQHSGSAGTWYYRISLGLWQLNGKITNIEVNVQYCWGTQLSKLITNHLSSNSHGTNLALSPSAVDTMIFQQAP